MTEGAAAPKRQIVDEAGDIGNREVVVRLRVIGIEVVGVLRRRRIAFKRSAGVIQRVLPGKAVQQRQAGDHALLIPHLQRIVVGIELVERFSNIRRPVGKGARVSGCARAGCVDDVALIAVEKTFQLQAVVADIGDVDQAVLRELPLHRKIVILHIAIAPILGHPGNVIGGGIEAGHQSRWEALGRGRVAAFRCRSRGDDLGGERRGAVIGGGWRDLADGGKLRLRGVDGENVAGACARVVHIACAKSAADGHLGCGRIRKADARRKVVQVRIDKRLAVYAGAGGWRNAVARDRSGESVRTVCEVGSQLET